MTFFSGTDTATLKEEGRDRNNFVSLIVNNVGNYTAAITRKINSTSMKSTISYNFFDKGEKHYTEEYISNEDKIEYFYLNIEIERDNIYFQDMEKRFEEIKEKKEKFKEMLFDINNKTNTLQPSISNKLNNRDFKDVTSNELEFDKNIIKQLTLQLVTGSIILSNNSKIDIKKWVLSMPTLYKKRFGEGEEGMKIFEEWADIYIDFIIWHSKDENLEILGLSDDEISSICAYNLIEELNRLPKNEYINGYIKVLKRYTI